MSPHYFFIRLDFNECLVPEDESVLFLVKYSQVVTAAIKYEDLLVIFRSAHSGVYPLHAPQIYDAATFFEIR
jgi:hypothetical protein